MEARRNKVQAWIYTHRAQTAVICVAVGLILVGLIGLIWVLLQPDPVTNTPSANDGVIEVDYKQKVTSISGEKFDPSYDLASGATFSVRFANLSCEDTVCSNIRLVQLGQRVLKKGEDYEVKKGSIILILQPSAFSEAKPGEVPLIMELTQSERTLHVGVKVQITGEASDCGDNEEFVDGICQKIETTDNLTNSSNNNSNNTPNSSRPSTSTGNNSNNGSSNSGNSSSGSTGNATGSNSGNINGGNGNNSGNSSNPGNSDNTGGSTGGNTGTGTGDTDSGDTGGNTGGSTDNTDGNDNNTGGNTGTTTPPEETKPEEVGATDDSPAMLAE